MSVNKYMHPRNIYKTPPNFKQMAIDYPEFRKHVKQDISGKIKVDFKNNETLCVLTQTLLKKDFDLDVNIPLSRLIPTVPLRLNYILWIEDLLNILSVENEQQIVRGIDIGTGASCIYPLLAAKKYEWHMIATEIDTESVNLAQENVNRNHLQHLISVRQTKEDTLLKDIAGNDCIFQFCMCNPPFFSSTSELDPRSKSRSENRSLPRNASSGTASEIVVSGGEVEFISKIIKESVELKTQIIIFTAMVGHKSSLPALKLLLRNVEVVSFKQTEFHQGHTTRWGLAWTFQNFDLRKIPSSVAAAKTKLKQPLKFIIANPDNKRTFEVIVAKVRELMQTLQMEYEEIKKCQFMTAFQATAKENTWSHQRRKRREQMRQQNLNSSNKSDLNVSDSSKETDKSGSSDISMETDEKNSSSNKRHRSDSDNEDEEYFNSKKCKIYNGKQDVFLRVNIILRKVASEYHVELMWVEGNAPKDALHQVQQYFKNNLK